VDGATAMLDKFLRLKKRIYKNIKSTPLTIVGCIDEFSDSGVAGWLSWSDYSPIKGAVEIYVNGELIRVIDEFCFREDLFEQGIARGIAAFDIEYLIPESDIYHLQVKSDDKVIVEKKIERSNLIIKNKDPYFNSFYSNSLSKRGTTRLDDGLVIQHINSSHFEKEVAGTYFYRINNLTNEVKTLDLGQRIVERIASNDTLYFTAHSNLTTTAVVEFLDSEGERLWSATISLQAKWNKYTIALMNIDYLLIEKAAQIKLSISIPENASLDLGALVVGTLDTTKEIKKPALKLEKLHNQFKNLINHSLQGFRVSEGFQRIERKQLIASGVQFESKSGVTCEVQMSKAPVGLNIATNELQGYARIAYSIDISCLKIAPLYGTISLAEIDNNLIKVIYIYGIGQSSDILNKLKLTRTLDGKGYQFSLSLTDVESLLRLQGQFYEFRLAVELNEHASASDFVIELNQEQLEKPVEKTTEIEDEAISSQLNVISGYFDIHPKENAAVSFQKSFVSNAHTILNVDIVIPIYNAKEYVDKCLKSIYQHTSMNFRLILMDDCSTDGVSELIDTYAEKYDNVIVIHHPKNKGYTGNVNAGFEISQTDWVLLLNSDTEVSPYWLENLFLAAGQEKAAIIGPLGNAASWQSVPNVHASGGGWDFNLLPEGITPTHISHQLQLNFSGEYPEAGVLNGFCQLINRKAFYEVGALDEVAFPKGYGEENDLCARLIGAGYKLLVCPNSYVYHHKSKSFGHEVRADLSKKAGGILKEKHPNYDWGLVCKQLYNNEIMISSRSTVKAMFEK